MESAIALSTFALKETEYSLSTFKRQAKICFTYWKNFLQAERVTKLIDLYGRADVVEYI